MKKPTPLNKLIVVVLITALVASVMMLYMVWSQKLRDDKHDKQAQSKELSTDDDLSRHVNDTPWRYAVTSQEYETKFNLQVASVSNSSAILTISGHGCNSMSAIVSTTEPESYAAERTYDGTAYYLSHSMTTRMACEGETASYDAAVREEIMHIFHSLERS